jgi:hypothetical protein
MPRDNLRVETLIIGTRQRGETETAPLFSILCLLSLALFLLLFWPSFCSISQRLGDNVVRRRPLVAVLMVMNLRKILLLQGFVMMAAWLTWQRRLSRRGEKLTVQTNS